MTSNPYDVDSREYWAFELARELAEDPYGAMPATRATNRAAKRDWKAIRKAHAAGNWPPRNQQFRWLPEVTP